MEVNPALDRLVWRYHGRGSREAALEGRKHGRIDDVKPRELCDHDRVGGRKTDDYRRARNLASQPRQVCFGSIFCFGNIFFFDDILLMSGREYGVSRKWQAQTRQA